jgi:hypothetical protein
MHMPPSFQVSQLATQCMMTQTCLSVCNTPYNPQCVASYQLPPSYFHPIGKTRASLLTEHWCEIIPNTAPAMLGIPKTKLTHARPTSWKGVQHELSNHTWSLDIVAVRNNEATLYLIDGLQDSWLQKLQRSIPEAF